MSEIFSAATDLFGQFCEIILFKISDVQLNIRISIEHEKLYLIFSNITIRSETCSTTISITLLGRG